MESQNGEHGANQAVKPMFKIRNYGNDTLCGNAAELKKALLENYKGDSVTVEDYRGRRSGLHFIDISPASEFSWSYSDKPMQFDADFG